MGLSDIEINKIRTELLGSQRPLFFFHDDPDGLASFLLLYRLVQKGNGVVVKAVPKIDSKFLRKVDEYSPDKIFILDIAMVEQEFLDAVSIPVIWIDHHLPLQRKGVLYFNPRISEPDDNIPVTHTCYRVVMSENVHSADIWIAAVGCIGDWHFPDFIAEFAREYPGLLSQEISTPDDALFKSKLGDIIKVFSFVLVGRVSDAMKCVKILTRVSTPYVLLNQETAAAKYVMRKYLYVKKLYDEVLAKALQSFDPSNTEFNGMFVYVYKGEMSFTKDLANEIQYCFPDKIVVIGREKAGEIKMSIRAKGRTIPPVLENALIGIEGYGGGHEYACGACVKKASFKQFLKNLKQSFDNASLIYSGNKKTIQLAQPER